MPPKVVKKAPKKVKEPKKVKKPQEDDKAAFDESSFANFVFDLKPR